MDHTPSLDPAPGETRWLAVALVNTELASRGGLVDRLGGASAVATWLASRDLLDGGTTVSDADAQRVRDLRAAMRRLFHTTVGGDPPAPDALAALNTASATAPGMLQLDWVGDRIVGRWRPASGPRPVDVALASLAADAMHLALGEDGGRLRTCGAHGCVRMFVQEHARRRWCSRTCGDRVRVARHYDRTRARPDEVTTGTGPDTD